jgi:type I restriction enzyme, S subunit
VKEQLNRDVGGSIIIHWRPDQVKNTIIPIISEKVQSKIQEKVVESSELRDKSSMLLDCGKRAIEKAIENSEEDALEWIEKELREIDARL